MNNLPSRRSVLAASASLLAAASARAATPPTSPAPRPASGPTSRRARQPAKRRDVPPQMSFIANCDVKLGMNLAVGGAFTHLSTAAEPEVNLINSWDLGRQVQMSYYSGPVPYEVPGHAGPPPFWRGIGWNPIQVGDDYGNMSKVLDHRNDGKELYVKCVPMQWPLDDVPGECTFECWATLEGPAVRVRCRLTMTRADATQWPARHQEMPAVYTNAPWYRLFTYAGDKPFEDDALKQIDHTFTAKEPWAHWQATERWAALVNEAGRGVGVWNPSCVRFTGGFAGTPGTGGPKDRDTGYASPVRNEVLDHNLVHEFRYALILGDLKSIRQWVYAQPERATPPAWTFESDRQGWFYRNATDAGWPIKGSLVVKLDGDNPQLISPESPWPATAGPRLTLDAAFTGGTRQVAVYWATSADADFSPKRMATFPVQGDGVRRAYTVDVGKTESYRGLITQLRFDPLGAGKPGDKVVVSGVKVGKA